METCNGVSLTTVTGRRRGPLRPEAPARQEATASTDGVRVVAVLQRARRDDRREAVSEGEGQPFRTGRRDYDDTDSARDDSARDLADLVHYSDHDGRRR